MTDNRSFEPVTTRFEDTWPNYSWAPLVRLVLALVAWMRPDGSARSQPDRERPSEPVVGDRFASPTTE
jgi:hypothetical protein